MEERFAEWLREAIKIPKQGLLVFKEGRKLEKKLKGETRINTIFNLLSKAASGLVTVPDALSPLLNDYV